MLQAVTTPRPWLGVVISPTTHVWVWRNSSVAALSISTLRPPLQMRRAFCDAQFFVCTNVGVRMGLRMQYQSGEVTYGWTRHVSRVGMLHGVLSFSGASVARIRSNSHKPECSPAGQRRGLISVNVWQQLQMIRRGKLIKFSRRLNIGAIRDNAYLTIPWRDGHVGGAENRRRITVNATCRSQRLGAARRREPGDFH